MSLVCVTAVFVSSTITPCTGLKSFLFILIAVFYSYFYAHGMIEPCPWPHKSLKFLFGSFNSCVMVSSRYDLPLKRDSHFWMSRTSKLTWRPWLWKPSTLSGRQTASCNSKSKVISERSLRVGFSTPRFETILMNRSKPITSVSYSSCLAMLTGRRWSSSMTISGLAKLRSTRWTWLPEMTCPTRLDLARGEALASAAPYTSLQTC